MKKESSVALNFSLKDLYRGLLRNSSTSREKNHHLFSGGLYFGGFDTVKEVLFEDKELALWGEMGFGFGYDYFCWFSFSGGCTLVGLIDRLLIYVTE